LGKHVLSKVEGRGRGDLRLRVWQL